ncbi:1-phosphatidylinositol 4,5-bisphosphate phosphodiesterase beta-2-like [Xyrauchen texanus]|uniref:1-phosphatidylinositol 4,5-bisphosphate phosphodiesterase beta-2-like n=1 Tax=Xyrauchen texanus TaxID=154827 RepID=UPI0022424502|nr:1-phosphatidylinositol 4,5-bisphosphate phosphodiesterase beta-2-like [Xyrauchen texanus]
MSRNRHALQEPDVKEYLVKGDRFTKWKEDSKKTTPVTMKMDPKGFFLVWTNQSKDTEFLDVATIRDTRAGKYAKLPKNPKVRNVFNMDFPDSHHLAKTLTIVTGTDMVNLTYHNFFAAKEVAQAWADDILAITYNTLRANACRQVFLEKVYVRLTLQANKDGKIPVKNIIKMFPADKKRVESALAAANLPKGKFDTIKSDVFTEAAFKTFLLHLCPRPEISEIFTSFTKGKGFMTKETMAKFLNEKQRDARLNEELFPLVRPEQMKNLIEKYEPSSSNASRGQISPDGLLFYLMGPETSVVNLDKLAQSHDMTQPLTHYFVKSSHNTYLTAGQLTGVSSPEMYRQCLLSGCRCLELDCWKGKPPDEEPIITHGFTMTTEILFKDVIEAIAESAFKTSKYPVVLSFENHVDSAKQQEKMANYCRTIFGDALLVDLLDKYPLKPGHPVPSPSELMGKILIKNKKSNAAPNKENAKKAVTDQPQVAGEGSGSNQSDDPNQPAPAEGQDAPHAHETHDDHTEEHDDHDEHDEEKMKNSDEGTAGQEVTAYEEMSAIVNYVQPNKFISFENAAKKNKSFVISSFVETKGESLIAKSAVDWAEYNKRQMSRIYPKGTRVDSSNYSPQPFWTAGCQFVALNYQTMDFPMQLNMALFEFNGRTGYLLKHDVLRRNDKKFDPFSDRIDTVIASTLTIKIYSGQFLSDKNVKTGVEVELIGLPKDPKKKYRTKWTTTPNAINPEWNEEPFVFEKILLPEMAYLRLVVHEDGGKFLGHRIIPLDALKTGFQHICLRSESNMQLMLPSVFVHIEVKDYIPAAFSDFTDALFNPVKTTKPPNTESSTYVSEYELPAAAGAPPAATPAPVAEPNAESPAEGGVAPEEKPEPGPAPTPEPTKPEQEPSPEPPNPEPEPAPEPTKTEPEPAPEPTKPEPEPAPEPPKPEPEPAPEPPKPEPEPAPEPPKPEPEPSPEPPKPEPTPEPEPEPATETPQPEPQAEEKPEESASAEDNNVTTESSPADKTSEETPSDPSDPPSVTYEELQQHKNFLKVTKKQEKDLKDTEKKFQKKHEVLTQKFNEQLKALKKKNLGKKTEGSDPAEQITELKEKLKSDLRALLVEQNDQLKMKKEQQNTERLTKLLEIAAEKHSSELKTLSSEMKKKRGKMKKSKSSDQLDSDTQSAENPDGTPQEQSLKKRQAATLANIRDMISQLNKDAVSEHTKKMCSLPSELLETVNSCIKPHFPEHMDKAEEKSSEPADSSAKIL